ncbi:MAG: hypothetical protein KF716_26495 [Anaerolineae bacterium]|nr:hypothetical protein [Anaerolineae bacterium]
MVFQQASTEPSSHQPADLPDVLGMITNGERLNISLLQCAYALHPRTTVLGQPLEALVLVQSAANKPIQVNLTVRLPKRDAAGNRLNLWTPKDNVQIVLQPAETGLLHIPIVSRQPTQPAEDLPITVKVEVKLPRNVGQVRPSTGGRAASILNMSPFRLSILREVGFRVVQQEEAHLSDTFSIVPGTISTAQPANAPRYETLWTAKDLEAEKARYAELEQYAHRFAATITRNVVLEPLQTLLETKFAAGGLPLAPAEALFAAKTLTYAMEDGLDLEPGFSLYEAKWFHQLVGLMAEPEMTSDIEALLTRLFPAILYDGVMLGLSLVARISEESLGTHDEHISYANEVINAVEGQASIDLGHAYLPLILAGLLLTYTVKGIHENPWTSLGEVRQAWHGRLRLADNEFEWVDKVFRLFYDEAERSLDEARIARPTAPRRTAASKPPQL